MKIVIAPDKFKGSLTSMEIIRIIKESALQHFKDAEVVEVPVADGGDGTVEALVYATGGEIKKTTATDPLGRQVECFYGDAKGTAVIGMAQCSGLALLSNSERNPLETSSKGTGELIKKALDDGFAKILVGIGGSATNDGGTGAMRSLGIKFLRADGSEIERISGKELINIARIDDSALDPRLKDADINVMCDVTNPLTGPEGATYTYGPQKGADEKKLETLEAGMLHYEKLINEYAGRKISSIPGTGAAGGIGYALMCFAGAKLTSGIDAVLELVRFDKLIEGADLVITGEGRIDSQSAQGKVVHGVAKYAKAAGVPVIVIAGSVGDGAEAVFPLGVNAIVPIPEAPVTLEYCIENAAGLLRKASDRAFDLIEVGRDLTYS